jgi:anti-anti-sigma factor
MLEITVTQPTTHRVRVALKGRLDTQTYSQCEERLRPLLATAHDLILDLSQLEYLSSMGLRVLLITSKTMHSRGGKCVLSNPQPPIRAVIEIAKALPTETIFASVAEADSYLDLMQRRVRETGSAANSAQT